MIINELFFKWIYSGPIQGLLSPGLSSNMSKFVESDFFFVSLSYFRKPFQLSCDVQFYLTHQKFEEGEISFEELMEVKIWKQF